ncbi:MAG: RNA polymerase sigma factor [Acidiferrobacteraceae bacterium]
MTPREQLYPLIAAAQTGDPAALDHLLRRCQPDIRRYARRHCLMGDVDDAVQETLMILSRRVQSLRILVAFSSWLFTIVRRECRRLERRVWGIEHYDEQKAEQWLAARSVDELRLDLARALESLPAHYREIILLRDFEERSIRELAHQLALTPAAVKSRLHRARQLMRDYLVEE